MESTNRLVAGEILAVEQCVDRPDLSPTSSCVASRLASVAPVPKHRRRSNRKIGAKVVPCSKLNQRTIPHASTGQPCVRPH